MKQSESKRIRRRLRRAVSGLLCAAILLGLLCTGAPLLAGTAHAVEIPDVWSKEYLEKLVEWGVMRGDQNQNLNPDNPITRAEFATMVNRAFGYKETGRMPFRDVNSGDWFYDDIAIAYNTGYLNGTSATTASPNSPLTREEAVVILGRNLMLQPTVGEALGFSDSRNFGEWSRGLVEPAVEAGLIKGYEDGTFAPKQAITRGEVASILVRAVGQPVQTPGEVSLGQVYNNVTITTSGVTLKDTVIEGDLYLTGGIGLGDVLLENVTVRGKIVDSGAGESEKGASSVILRNVTADQLVVDSIKDEQTISLRAEGGGRIASTSVRTPAHIEDASPAGCGLVYIELNGEANSTNVRLAGTIKEVVNKVPGSRLTVAQGVAEKVTVDEAAVNSTIVMENNSRIKELNLDAGIRVSGNGDIDKLMVSGSGANVSMLPDDINVRPGITASVGGMNMDSVAAAESSSLPRILAGYPTMNDVAPTSATATFSANKPGTIYWAITALADGSVTDENDVISPPSYGKIILKSGKIAVKESKATYTTNKISGLTSDGSYYLTCLVVDERGNRSPMKVIAFTTPDDTVPAFASGYPAMTQVTDTDAQVTVMTTKSCQMYYALLPKGAAVPKAADFKANSISGNLGYGSVDAVKNTTIPVKVNEFELEEKTPYVLYLWLTDYDGGKSSAVRAVNFTTADGTPPIVINLRQTDTKATSASVSYTLTEQGTLYWAVVKQGANFIVPTSDEGKKLGMRSLEAKEQVASGVGTIKKGSHNVAANKANSEVSFNVTGLNIKNTGTSSYDLYYVARDKEGNWSDEVGVVTIYTLDNTKPTVVQKFTSFNVGQTETTTTPLADTDIKLAFSKEVQAWDRDANGDYQTYPFLQLYQTMKRGGTDAAEARERLITGLRNHIKLYQVVSGIPRQVAERTEGYTGTDWVIDYSRAEVRMEDTEMVIVFPYNSVRTTSAHNLANGATYYFEISNIQDTTTNHNEMARPTMPRFTTMPAQINISGPVLTSIKNANGAMVSDHAGSRVSELIADFVFQLDPRATGTSPEGVFYDLMLWSNTSLKFDVYRRDNDPAHTLLGDGWSEWSKVTNDRTGGAFSFSVSPGSKQYVSVANAQQLAASSATATAALSYDELRDLKEKVSYQYAVHIVTLGDNELDRSKWNIDATFEVTVASAGWQQIQSVSNAHTADRWKALSGGNNPSVDSIGNPDPYTGDVGINDTVAPLLRGNYPNFVMRDTSGDMILQLDRPGTIYYVVTPVLLTGNPVTGTLANGNKMEPGKLVSATEDPGLRSNQADNVPLSGEGVRHDLMNVSGAGNSPVGEAILFSPGRNDIISTTITDPDVRQGQVSNNGTSTTTVKLTNLYADTWYYVYLMFQGNNTSERAVCYKFKTQEPMRPILTLSGDNKTDASVDATVTNSSGNVTARLLPLSMLPSTVFGQAFDDQTLGAAYGSIDKLSTEGKTWFAEATRSYTILQAMILPSGGSGSRSIFDAYASQDLQDLITSEITSGSVGGMIKYGMEPFNMGDTKTMTFSLENVNVNYFCVAVAENTSPMGLNSFRGLTPVQIVDTKEPTAEELSGTLTIVTESAEADASIYGAGAVKNTYYLRGTLTVQYANFLYRYDSGRMETLPFTQGDQRTGPQASRPSPKSAFEYTSTVSGVDNKTWWYGVSGLYNSGDITVRTTADAPQLTREFTIEVNMQLNSEVLKMESSFLTDSKGDPVKADNGEFIVINTLQAPTLPQPKGSIPLPTDFVNRNNYPASVNKSIQYTTDKNGNVTLKLA